MFVVRIYLHCLLDELVPYVLSAIRNHDDHGDVELTKRALKFCLQRITSEGCCETMDDVQEVLLAAEGIHVEQIGPLFCLSSVWFLACKATLTDPKNSRNLMSVAGTLTKIADRASWTEDVIELYIGRLLKLLIWTSGKPNGSVISICEDIASILFFPSDVTLNAFAHIKHHEEMRQRQKCENIAVAASLLSDIGTCYWGLKSSPSDMAKKLGTELLCQTVLYLTGVNLEEEEFWSREKDGSFSRSQVTELLFELLEKELNHSSPDEQVVQSISTSICIEAWRNLNSVCWTGFVKLCQSNDLSPSMMRMFMTFSLLRCEDEDDNLSVLFSILER